MPEQPSFKRAVFWAYAMRWADKGFGAAFAFVLAAILGPRDFGTVALAMIYIAFVQMVLDQGLFAAVIQRKDLRPEHLDSIFWFNVAVSLALIAVTIALSGPCARVYHLPQLGPVLSVLSLIVLVEALAMMQRAVLQREMDFRSLAIRSGGSVLIGGAVGLAMAFTGFGIWALVGQRITEDTSALVLLWALGRWRPRLYFSFLRLRELLGFSVAAFATKIGDFAYNYADAAIMGLFFGPVAVGLYKLAQKPVSLILDTATNSLQVVSFSQFSLLQDRPVELRKSVVDCLKLASLITFPPLAGLALSSRQALAVLGSKWAPAVGALAVLCAFGMAQTLAKFTGPLLMARSKPHLEACLSWIVNAASIASLIAVSALLKAASVEHQVTGIALTRLAVAVGLVTPVFVFFLLRFSGLSARGWLRAIWPAAGTACAVAAILALLNASRFTADWRPALVLAADIIVGGLAAIAAMVALEPSLIGDLRRALSSMGRPASFEMDRAGKGALMSGSVGPEEVAEKFGRSFALFVPQAVARSTKQGQETKGITTSPDERTV